MTRKDYEIIADGFARTRPTRLTSVESDHYYRQWLVTRDAVMGALQADNPRFERARFIRATEA